MRIFAITLVKDELDIIDAYLDGTSAWADRILVLDNGSTDGTWERIQARADDCVVPYERYEGPYSNALRERVFNAFRDEAEEGDWWCVKADVDEFYLEDPRGFLAGVPSEYGRVRKKSIEYCISEEQSRSERFSGDFAQDRHLLRFVKPLAHLETRFYRHRPELVWHAGRRDPEGGDPPWPQPILCAHYQFRSPQQMQKRFEIRKAAKANRQDRHFQHVVGSDWRAQLAREQDLIRDRGEDTWRSLPHKRGGVFKRISKALARLTGRSPARGGGAGR